MNSFYSYAIVCFLTLNLQSSFLIAQESPEAAIENIGSHHVALHRYCQKIAKQGFSGTVLAARKGKIVLHHGYGMADRNSNRPNGPETVYEIASLAKQFTTAAILKLEEAGKLSTDDPINKYLPGVPQEYADVTIYHLMTHSGGLPRGGQGRGKDLAKALRDHLWDKPTAKAGTEYSYSNVDSALLAGIVDVVSGTSLEEWSRDVLFKPGGMEKTSFCGEPMKHADVALGYSRQNKTGRMPNQDPYPPLDQFGYEYRGMGGVITNASDLYRWTQAVWQDEILSESSRQKYFKPFLNNYACGWEVFSFPDGRKCVGHGGSVAGFVCKLWMFPDDESALIVLSNRGDFNYYWLNAMYDRLFQVNGDPK